MQKIDTLSNLGKPTSRGWAADLADVLGLLMAAGAPSEIYLELQWPAHQALLRLHSSGRWPSAIAFGVTGDPTVGRAVRGFGDAVNALLAADVVAPSRRHGLCVYATGADRLRDYRRRLMRLEPASAAALHMAGDVWRRQQDDAVRALMEFELRLPVGLAAGSC